MMLDDKFKLFMISLITFSLLFNYITNIFILNIKRSIWYHYTIAEMKCLI